MSAQTLPALFFESVAKFNNPSAFLVKVNGIYEARPALEVEREVLELGVGLRTLGLRAGDRVAIIARSSYLWALADLAIQVAGAVTVPIYPSLPAETVQKLLVQARCRAVVAEDATQAAKVAGAGESCGELTLRVQLAGRPAEGWLERGAVAEAGAAAGPAAAAALRAEALAIEPEAVCSVVFTSGTSGEAKGVLLSHRNLVSNLRAALAVVPIGPGDTALSCLPLSHLLERTAGLYAMLAAGAAIAYAESPESFAQNLSEVRPTLMIGVPRLYEKIYSRMLTRAAASGPLSRRLFGWSRRVALEWSARRLAGERPPLGLRLAHGLADRLVYAQLRARTGGRLRFFISGAAALAPEIASYFYAAGLPILEGYGLTETSPIIAVNGPESLRIGTVGRPLPGVELRLAADGEIFTRGPHVMQGYDGDPAATRAAIDAEGWFATGDIGELDAQGYLRITDRKKDLIVTAGGKNVAPQPIESRLRQERYIAECMLLGDGRPFIAALIVPDFEALRAWAAEHGLPPAAPAALVQAPAVRALFAAAIARLNAGLPPHEQVRGWRLIDHELTLGAGELTPSLKVRRHRVLQRYAELVAQIYAPGGAQPPAPAS